MILVESFLSNTIPGSRLGVYHTHPAFAVPICKLTAHSTGQCSQVHRPCSGTHQPSGSHRCGRTWHRGGKGQARGCSHPTLLPSLCPESQGKPSTPQWEFLLGPGARAPTCSRGWSAGRHRAGSPRVFLPWHLHSSQAHTARRTPQRCCAGIAVRYKDVSHSPCVSLTIL